MTLPKIPHRIAFILTLISASLGVLGFILAAAAAGRLGNTIIYSCYIYCQYTSVKTPGSTAILAILAVFLLAQTVFQFYLAFRYHVKSNVDIFNEHKLRIIWPCIAGATFVILIADGGVLGNAGSLGYALGATSFAFGFFAVLFSLTLAAMVLFRLIASSTDGEAVTAPSTPDLQQKSPILPTTTQEAYLASVPMHQQPQPQSQSQSQSAPQVSPA